MPATSTPSPLPPPTVIGSSTQPQSGVGPAAAKTPTTDGTGPGPLLGDTAPSPLLFAGSNPLAGVLPGSWEDPFIVPGGTAVPQFFVASYHVPFYSNASGNDLGEGVGITPQ